MDLTLHNVTRPADAGQAFDIGIHGGKIVTMTDAGGLEPGERALHLDGRLVLPGFVETHIHLDKSCILERCSMKGGLTEAIAEVAGLKAAFTEDDVAERAARTLRKCVLNGTTRMRTHVEVDPVIGLRGLNGVKRAIAEFAWAIDVEICVFPQEGLLNNPGTDELMVAALQDGATVVGAAPYTDSDPHGQIDRVFELAREYNVDIDMHLDFGSDASVLDVDHVCRRADEHGWGGRVAVGHVTKFAQMTATRLREVARRLADAGVAATVLPSTDLFLMHRDHDSSLSVPRGVTPLHMMAAEGVNCSLSTNNVLNPFTPFGDCSMIRMANLYANIAQVGQREEMAGCLDMVTARSARLMNLKDYGVEVGAPADVVVIDATDPTMAVAELAQPMYGFKRGRPVFSHALPELHFP
ncbi:amidohydrolase [Meridianimarinicoccus roseus]|jgi:cytosine deaminase|uniref:Amidohydrolase n=1 Tax=Meridianimarinicoccus roseus TaxID=2072018 RepID=A0A2V2LLX1_9RHOB|nr:amidohydrolase family protein [Meridianimarinicoccus roseus]PWR04604.1 amidohydrolase [Meridianimarinicoccus roseus]